MESDCLICERIEMIDKDENHCFVKELQSGYVVLGDYQFYPGYTVFLSKEHKQELHQLVPSNRRQFLWEMSLVAQAVYNIFKPQKLNYELLGNADSHMHWHLYPRYKDDPDPNRPIWSYPKEKRCNSNTKIKRDFINKYATLLKREIEKLTK